MYTYLHSHPCYVITWIKKLLQEVAEVEGLIYQIYGRVEMRDNPRVINTLSVIARAVFDSECAENSLAALLTMGQESKFRALFLLIINNQSQNKNFDRLIIRGMIHYMRNKCKPPKEDQVEGEEVDDRPSPAHIKGIITDTM